jgi:hypothetical protein
VPTYDFDSKEIVSSRDTSWDRATMSMLNLLDYVKKRSNLQVDKTFSGNEPVHSPGLGSGVVSIFPNLEPLQSYHAIRLFV